MEQAVARARHAPERVHARACGARRERLGCVPAALEDDFDTPAALRGAARVGLDRAARPAAARARHLRARLGSPMRERGAARGRRARRAPRRRRGRRATSRRPTGCATSWPRSAGRCATATAATTSSGHDARPRLRAPGGAGGAARAPGGARGLGDRARGQGGGLAGRGPSEAEAGARALRAGRDAGPPGRLALVEPVSATPMPTSSRRPRSRCSSCSTASPILATSAPSPERRRRGRDRA